MQQKRHHSMDKKGLDEKNNKDEKKKTRQHTICKVKQAEASHLPWRKDDYRAARVDKS